MLRRSAMVLASAAALAAPAAFAQTGPREMTWTAYDTGSSGFNIAVAIGQAFKTGVGVDVRILPAGNDVARLSPLRAGRAVASAMGIGTYFAQEGVLEFGVKAWGPQPMRLLMTTSSCNGITLAAAKDAGIREVKDIRGKRVGVVVGSPALTQGALGLIAFGGLTEKDVKLVEFSSNNAMWKGMVNNEVDVALSSTISGQSREMDASPRGVVWPPFPAADKEGWARIHKRAPYFVPVQATCGAGGLSKDKPVGTAGYAYPIFMSYASAPTDAVQTMVRGFIEQYDTYKNAAPGADGMALDRQVFTWVVPYHDGAIAAFKAKGVWNDAAQKHNDALLARQKVLADAWKAFTASAPADDKEFSAAWTKARAAALRARNMDVIFE
ncbi:MAG: TAXI family TRAP transporter solute-binding subunit [Alphaproteobacteria bacterium]|nr:TAXI family TRAP transporter solute-binding subunit [Alphaproteobacteria bacterium]